MGVDNRNTLLLPKRHKRRESLYSEPSFTTSSYKEAILEVKTSLSNLVDPMEEYTMLASLVLGTLLPKLLLDKLILIG